MRLIDADKLKIEPKPSESMDFDKGVLYVLECIDKAPTVEALTIEDIKKAIQRSTSK